MIAKAMRAILLASATATSVRGLLWMSFFAQDRSARVPLAMIEDRMRAHDEQCPQISIAHLRDAAQSLTHSSDQIAHLFADPWSATARTGFPSPIRDEAHSMPTRNSLGPDDGYGVKNARTATIEPNEQGAVGSTQMQSAWCALLQDIELMSAIQDFGFQPPPRLEAVARHADEKARRIFSLISLSRSASA
jgi:hypothetical protein